ncbi:MAG: hypothetical protein D6762_05345 [Candidatus Neomarinimicrobiota bacterium]|nr:MAG: hypothetical protein D6762_05345 [Candidatus Neomarinimicrobiota bacterium]
MVTLVLSNRSITCIVWGKGDPEPDISRCLDQPYYKQLIHADRPADLIREAFEALTRETDFTGESVEVIVDDTFCQTSALTVDEHLDEPGVQEYLRWWIDQSWPESWDQYQVSYFCPETDVSFLWVAGITTTLAGAVSESVRSAGGNLVRFAPVSSTLISLQYPQNSLWTLVEPRSYTIAGSQGSLPFKAGISFYSGSVRIAELVGDTKTVEPLLLGPSYRTPFHFIDPLPESRQEVWARIPVTAQTLHPDLEAFGEDQGWKRELRRNLGILSAVIAAEKEDRIIHFGGEEPQESQPEPEADLEELRLQRLKQRMESSRPAEESATPVPEAPPTRKKRFPWTATVLVILLLALAYLGGYLQPVLTTVQTWLGSPVSATARSAEKKIYNLAEARALSQEMIKESRKWIDPEVVRLEAWDKWLWVVTRQDTMKIRLNLARSDLSGLRVSLPDLEAFLDTWSPVTYRLLPPLHKDHISYIPLVVRIDDIFSVQEVGEKLLEKGDNVILRKITVDKGDTPSAHLYFSILTG